MMGKKLPRFAKECRFHTGTGILFFFVFFLGVLRIVRYLSRFSLRLYPLVTLIEDFTFFILLFFRIERVFFASSATWRNS